MGWERIDQKAIIGHLGFEELNEMQVATIAAAKKHNNVLLLAPTGSGKTVAYLLAALHKLKAREGVQLLIIAPTRELVLQIVSVIQKMKLSLKVNACYGGHPLRVERKELANLPNIVVGTPGRIKDHMERELITPPSVFQLVFDEFDKSLEFGFSAEMEYITGKLYNAHHKILASATKSIEIPDYLAFESPHTIEVASDDHSSLQVQKIVTPKDGKLEGLLSFLHQLAPGQNAIVFSNHRDACDRISEYLDQHTVPHCLFHGGLEQPLRELELTKFRNGSAQVMIASDIAARGIDVPELDYVVHYQIPPKETAYIHRNGRTARMKASGTSILILTDQDYVPPYLTEEPELLTLATDHKIGQPSFITLKINKGKKDKVSKGDIVGYFLQFEIMQKDDVGQIELKDHTSIVAVSRDKHEQLLSLTQGQKLKGKSARIELI